MRIVHKIIFALAGVAALFLWSLPPSLATGDLTFNKDIAPLFFKNCAECHRPGETAPFSALTYKDVRPWAKSIREKSWIARCRPGMPIRIPANGPMTAV